MLITCTIKQANRYIYVIPLNSIIHDLKVDYITEQLYFYSMNSTIQCVIPTTWHVRSQSQEVVAIFAYFSKEVISMAPNF